MKIEILQYASNIRYKFVPLKFINEIYEPKILTNNKIIIKNNEMKKQNNKNLSFCYSFA